MLGVSITKPTQAPKFIMASTRNAFTARNHSSKEDKFSRNNFFIERNLKNTKIEMTDNKKSAIIFVTSNPPKNTNNKTFSHNQLIKSNENPRKNDNTLINIGYEANYEDNFEKQKKKKISEMNNKLGNIIKNENFNEPSVNSTSKSKNSFFMNPIKPMPKIRSSNLYSKIKKIENDGHFTRNRCPTSTYQTSKTKLSVQSSGKIRPLSKQENYKSYSNQQIDRCMETVQEQELKKQPKNETHEISENNNHFLEEIDSELQDNLYINEEKSSQSDEDFEINHDNLEEKITKLVKDFEDITEINKKRYKEFSYMIGFQRSSTQDGVTNQSQSKLNEIMHKAVASLEKTVEFEAKFGIMARDYEKMRHSNFIYQRKFDSMKKRINIFKDKISRTKAKNLTQSEKCEVMEKDILSKKLQLKDSSHRIELLEKNIEAFSTRVTDNNKEKFIKTLNEMIKENYTLKRTGKIKNEKYKEQKNAKQLLETKMLKMSKSRKIQYEPVEIDNEEKLKTNFQDIEDKIPINLDYRNANYNKEHINKLNEIRQNELSQVNLLRDLHYKTLRDHPEIRGQIIGGIDFLQKEYNTYNDLAEKLNVFCIYLYDNFFDDDIDKIIHSLRENIYTMYSFTQINLWIKERSSDLFYSKNKDGNETRCLSDKGLIGRCYLEQKPCMQVCEYDEQKKPFNMVELCEDSMIQQSVYVENSIVQPILSEDKTLLAILELSNSEYSFENIDEQYFIRIITQFIPKVFNKIIEKNNLRNEIDYFGNIVSVYNKLYCCENLKTFIYCAMQSIKEIANASDVRIYILASENEVWRYKVQEQNDSTENFLIDIEKELKKPEIPQLDQIELEKIELLGSLAKQAIQNARPIILTSINSSKYFNKQIDIDTNKPLYILPIAKYKHVDYKENNNPSNAKNVFGVVEIALSQKPLRLSFGKEKNGLNQLFEDDGVKTNIDFIMNKTVEVFSSVMTKQNFDEVYVSTVG